jgi:hypothetical protein
MRRCLQFGRHFGDTEENVEKVQHACLCIGHERQMKESLTREGRENISHELRRHTMKEEAELRGKFSLLLLGPSLGEFFCVLIQGSFITMPLNTHSSLVQSADYIASEGTDYALNYTRDIVIIAFTSKSRQETLPFMPKRRGLYQRQTISISFFVSLVDIDILLPNYLNFVC